MFERLQERQGSPEVHNQLREIMPGLWLLPGNVREREYAMHKHDAQLQDELHTIATGIDYGR